MASDDERYLPGPPQRSLLARLVALLALAGVVVIVVMVVSSSLGSDDQPADGGAKVEKQKKKGDGKGAETPKEYTVQDGDSLSSIAAQFGISVKRIERLNPKLDPNALATGQVIKLR